MIEIKKVFDGIEIVLSAIKMGKDWNISIYGGEKHHIGAVALGIPRESLNNNDKVSASVSLLTVTGHKEDEVVLPIVKKVTKKLNAKTVVVCGIHKDNITSEEITIIFEGVNELVEKFMDEVLRG